MKEGFRQSMAWLHTWTGLVLGWLLFAIFASGTSAYFYQEITAWMQPEVRASSAGQDEAFASAIRWLEHEAPEAHVWEISPPDKRSAATSVYWEMGEGTPPVPGLVTDAKLDGSGQKVIPRETRGGEFLYAFHYELHYLDPIAGRWIVGIAAMFMLIGLISGVITHKKIFADFFLLRLGKGQRSWLDAHNVMGVLVLPFCLMITYTGLVIFGAMYMPSAIAANFADEEAFYDEAFPHEHPPERSGVNAPLAPLAPMLAQARARFGGNSINSISITNPGDRTSTVGISASSADQIGVDTDELLFSGTTGALIRDPFPLGGAVRTEGVLFGLHMGHFSDITLRWLYFLSGLAGTGMIASGLVLWTVKRRTKLPDPARPHFGFRLVEKLNIATIAGFPAAIAVYFLANRLLPVGMMERAEWEIDAMFIAWGAFALWAAVRPERFAWREVLLAAAAGFLAVPMVSALTTDRALPVSIAEGDWLFAGFELVMLLLAGTFGWAALKLEKRHLRAATPVTPARAVKVEAA